MADCVFCRIASGTPAVARLHEDDRCFAIADMDPKAPVHLLVIPKEHLASVDAVGPLQEVLVGHLVAVASSWARGRGLDASGYRLVFNHGADAGQTVGHLHLHLLAGRALGSMG